jgi:hypothetical protein
MKLRRLFALLTGASVTLTASAAFLIVSGGRGAVPAGGGGDACADPTTTLGIEACSLTTNEWGSITVNGMTESLITRGDSDSIISYAPRGHWDSIAKEALFYGSTHGTQHLKRMIRYVDATNTWDAEEDGAPETDGADSHGYFHFALRQSDGQRFIRHYNSATVSQRSPSGSWSTIASLPGAAFVEWNVANGLEWFPEYDGGNGGLIFSGGGIVAAWQTNSWTTLLDQAIAGDYHTFSVYNPDDNRVYVGGGNGSTDMWRVDPDGTVTQVADTPFVVGASGSDGQGFIFPAANGGKMFAVSTTGSIREYTTGTPGSWSAEISTLPFTPSGDLYFGVSVSDYGAVTFTWLSGGLTPSTTMYVWRH